MTEPVPPQLLELLNPATGVVAIAARHIESGRRWRHNEHLRLPSASLIKLPILAAFWQTVEAGRLDPNERVILAVEALRVEGTGVLKALAPRLQPTWSDLATLMITVSDNVATNLLIDRLGMETIQAWIDKSGLAETRIERRMMDRSAMSAGRGNWTSAMDMEVLLSAGRRGRRWTLSPISPQRWCPRAPGCAEPLHENSSGGDAQRLRRSTTETSSLRVESLRNNRWSAVTRLARSRAARARYTQS
jgi:hypothetical protein